MFSRARRHRDGWFSSFRRSKSDPSLPNLLPESDFALAIEKERCRAERRDLIFCIIRFEFLDNEKSPVKAGEYAEKLARRFKRRLRITDEIGAYRDNLCVLLPETIPLQAARVANDLTQIAADEGINVATDILAFPEVDSTIPPSNDHQTDGFREYELPFSEDESSEQTFDSPPDASGNADSGNGLATMLRPVSKMSNTIKVQRLGTSEPTPLWKRSLDVFGASAGLLALSPLFLCTAVAVRINSPGPAFFLQWREGKDGKLFKIYKFRTMREGADEEKAKFRSHSEQDGPAFKLKNDPRLTGIGKFLRKSCVDELPQLINVLKGEMSLVGPRPLPVDESLNCSHWHRRRLDVLPGMTCIWQVDGGRDIAFDEWMRMDLEYVRNCSLATDTRLILKTIMVTALHRGSV